MPGVVKELNTEAIFADGDATALARDIACGATLPAIAEIPDMVRLPILVQSPARIRSNFHPPTLLGAVDFPSYTSAWACVNVEHRRLPWIEQPHSSEARQNLAKLYLHPQGREHGPIYCLLARS